jgi:large subunit ribosomal protein L17
MRHGDKINNLGRKKAHRVALMSNLTCQLIQYKRINTTLAKAKALRVYAEPLINRSKVDNMNNRRVVFSKLQDKEAIKELFGVISDKIADRPGGYTRIIKLPFRAGDAANMAMIELVDFNELYTKDSAEKEGKKTRRSRRAGGTTAKATAPVAETATEAPVTEVATETPATETPTAEVPTAEGTDETNA